MIHKTDDSGMTCAKGVVLPLAHEGIKNRYGYFAAL